MEQYLAFKTRVVNKDFENWTIIGLYVVDLWPFPLFYSKPQGSDKSNRGKLLRLSVTGFYVVGPLALPPFLS